MHKKQFIKLQDELQQRVKKKTARRLVRYGVIVLNVIILSSVVYFVATHTKNNQSLSSSIALSSTSSSVNDPLDQLSSGDIALTVAKVANLPEVTAVKDQSETVNAELSLVPTDSNIAVKSQVVTTAYKSNQDIQNYTVMPGDTLASIAAKFNITTNSLQWSNHDTTGVTPGLKLLIPPVNGIVYAVQPGDTIQSLAQRYNANLTQLVAYNDAEISGIRSGELVVIPNGQQPTAPSYNYFSAVYSGNGYDLGYCTWYVASQISVPNNWGNASSWAYYAGLSGWGVSSVPTIGSIAQTANAAGGEGHVAIVTAVSPNGQEIQYRDMNGVAGWDRVGQSGWVPVSTYQHFITH